MANQQSDPGRIGQLPDGYRPVRELSRDQSGVTYLAEDVVHGGRVALTVLGRPGDPERLAREMDAVTGLRHPNILPVHVVGDGDGRACLVTPHVDDPHLDERLRQWGPLPVGTALQILGQVAGALDAAHGVGVVHGGVRPGAVRFAAGTERPYLAGFGVIGAQAPDSAAGDPSTVEHLAPEQVAGAPQERRTDVHAFGGLLFCCLTGAAPFDGADPGSVRTGILHADPPRVSAYRHDLPVALDHVVATAMAKDPAHRFGTCTAVVEAAAAAVGMGGAAPAGRGVPPVRRVRWRIVLAALVAVVLVAAGALAAPHVVAAIRPTAEDLARVPAALRGDCDLADPDPRLPAADRVLRCSDGGGQEALVGLFPDEPAAAAAYDGLVASSPGARSGTGDCGRGTGSEHRYPGVGELRGRVLCDRVGPAARLAWIDHANRAVAVADRVDGNAAELYLSWSGWMELPPFPVPQEQQLLDALSDDGCQRAPAGRLDGLDGVVAAVECVPAEAGGVTVTYYRFSDQDALSSAYDSDVALFAAPSGVFCPDAASGVGEDAYTRLGLPAGRVACGKDRSGAPSLTWTVDAMLVLGRATGHDPAALAQWWGASGGPTMQAWADAVNARSTPPFPTAEEDELLRRIPAASRGTCVRPEADTVRAHALTEDVVAVMCRSRTGPSETYYYRFADPAALAAALGPATGPDCTSVPPGSRGAAPYTRPDGSTGILTCGTNEAGRTYLAWTDDQASILGVAFDDDPARLIRWWQTQAGPL